MSVSSDPLFGILSAVRCPSCGTLESKGTFKCPECGLFHSSLPMEDRQAPSPEERVQQREIDPSAYSLSSSSKLISESFDETDEIQSWTGGNTDFSDLGDEDPPVRLLDGSAPDVELIHDE